MQFFAVAALVATAMATPALQARAQVCPPGLYSNPQCCATDVLGLADLDCKVPTSSPTSGSDFSSICASVAKQAKCCAIPVAGQDVLCIKPVGAA